MMAKAILGLALLKALIVNASFQDHHAEIARRQTVSIPLECTYADLVLNICQTLSPGFNTMVAVSRAPCLCYSDTAWAPQLFDRAIETCASWAQTADPVDYPGIATYEGFCTSVGDVLHPAAAPATTTTTPVPTPPPPPVQSTTTSTTPPPVATPTTPPTPVQTPTATPPPPPPVPAASPSSSLEAITTNPGCAFVSSALSYCESATPGWSSLLPAQMATCLCYSSTAFNPAGFDQPISTCAEFVQTASPTDYPVLSGLEGFCATVGDVVHSSAEGGGAANTGKPLLGGETIFGFTQVKSTGSGSASLPVIMTTTGRSNLVPQATTITLSATTSTSSAAGMRSSDIDWLAKTVCLSSLAVVLGLLVVL